MSLYLVLKSERDPFKREKFYKSGSLLCMEYSPKTRPLHK
jgi:hypothetical protein